MSPLLVLVAVTILLVAASAALSIDHVRHRLVGTSGIRAALIPLIAAATLWASVFATDILKGRIEERTAPEDVLSVFVENIAFGFPVVSTDCFTRDFTASEVRKELAPLRSSTDQISLTAEEIERINAIAMKSGQLDRLAFNQTITTADVATALSGPIMFGFNYVEWAKTAKSWEEFLRTTSAKSKPEALAAFTERIQSVRTAAGLFQGIVGMRARQVFELAPVPGDCSEAPLPGVGLETRDNMSYLVFKTFRSIIGKADDFSERKKAMQDLAYLFQHGCIETLANVCRSASETFGSEEKLMREYVREWNRLLASKEAESITIRLAVANVGRFDSFVRREAMVAIGTKGSTEKIRLQLDVRDGEVVREDDEAQERIQSNFISVKSRTTTTLILQAKLPPEFQKKIHGAFQSEQTQLRVGLIASAGSGEGEVLTRVVPFSSQVLKAAKDRVQKMKVDF